MRESAGGRHRTSIVALAASSSIPGVLWLFAACAGGDRPAERAGGGVADTATPAPAPAATQPPRVVTGGGGTAPNDPRVIALGDSIFHGRVAGGTCATCHGQDAKGTQIGPDLTDAQWLHGDGSYQFIINTVSSGVTTPKQYPGAMPPMGGASLTPEQARAVAAYVYSLSHGS